MNAQEKINAVKKPERIVKGDKFSTQMETAMRVIPSLDYCFAKEFVKRVNAGDTKKELRMFLCETDDLPS